MLLAVTFLRRRTEPVGRSGDVEFGVHAGAVVAGVVADQLVAAGGQGQRGPSGRSRHDAVSLAGDAAGGRLPDAARLVDLAVGPGWALSDALSRGKGQHDQLVRAPPEVRHPQRDL